MPDPTAARAAEARAAAANALEAAAGIANAMQQRAALNAQELKQRHPELTLDRLREIDNRMAGQRHAADEIARAIRALSSEPDHA